MSTRNQINGSSGLLHNTDNKQNNSPFGNSRLGRGRDNNTTDNTPPPDPNTYVDAVITPVERTAVRFGLLGLGDPFYRVLGHDMDPDMGDLAKLAAELERGSDRVTALTAKLNEAWATYELNGAMLVFKHDNKVTRALASPEPMPTITTEDDKGKETEQTTGTLTLLRAIDPVLTLNVLARARWQVLLAGAPLVFGQEYMRRQLITDDPRLVALAQATGSLPDA